MTCMKTLPKMDISDELNAQINENIKISDLCKADVVRQALESACRNLPPDFNRLRFGWRNGFVKPWLNPPSR